MIAKELNINNPDERFEIEKGYYELFSPDLQCVPEKNCPDFLNAKVLEEYRFVAAYIDDEMVGLCAVYNDYVIYPVMNGDYVKILKALILKSYEMNNNYLRAWTDNELILETAVDMGIGVVRTGNALEFK